jgi:hypothetical protein
MKFTRLTADVGNVSSMVKLKRLGKIRLGIKKKSANTGKEFPSETEHFICPPEVEAVYGDTPTELDAMFASNDPEEVYTEKLALYGSGSGLRCHGNGVTAERKNEAGQWEGRKCPCEFLKTEQFPKGQCTPQAHLMVMLPKISMWGCYQITTRSLYARAGILASLKQLQDTIGRIAYIPLKLNRVPQEITHGDSKKTHYIVGFVPALTLPQIIELRSKPELMVLPAQYQIEGPVDTNPEDDPVDMVVDREDGVDAEKLADMDDAQLAEVQAKLRDQAAKKPTTIKPTPQQTPGPSASTLPGQAVASGTPVKSEAPAIQPNGTAIQGSLELPAPTRLGTHEIPASQWAEVVAYVDADMDLHTLKEDWKTENKCAQVIRLTARGQQHLIHYLREQAGAAFPY